MYETKVITVQVSAVQQVELYETFAVRVPHDFDPSLSLQTLGSDLFESNSKGLTGAFEDLPSDYEFDYAVLVEGVGFTGEDIVTLS